MEDNLTALWLSMNRRSWIPWKKKGKGIYLPYFIWNAYMILNWGGLWMFLFIEDNNVVHRTARVHSSFKWKMSVHNRIKYGLKIVFVKPLFGTTCNRCNTFYIVIQLFGRKSNYWILVCPNNRAVVYFGQQRCAKLLWQSCFIGRWVVKKLNIIDLIDFIARTQFVLSDTLNSVNYFKYKS